MDKNNKNQLLELEKQVNNLESSPLFEFRQEQGYQPVFGEGDPDAEIMFIGEAPGAQEAQTGRPFVGRAGKMLDSFLESVDLDREDVYITNVVKDRPPNNRNPRADEINTYAPFLKQEIAIIQPKIIATLGRFATDFIFDLYKIPAKGQKMGALHGKIFKAENSSGEINILPLYHPAAIFYNRNLQETMLKDFQKFKKIL
ncbi:MAG: uracil-DNA glycosylase [Alkalibacterium sp.]|uniref:uracil-DNA glycosylase n=1 Tax=Alkalibacterium sp. TaxID=1872447 RepID=UPI0039711461